VRSERRLLLGARWCWANNGLGLLAHFGLTISDLYIPNFFLVGRIRDFFLALAGVPCQSQEELLGHESSKTTEIYTHITHKGWDKIKSPIDSLDV